MKISLPILLTCACLGLLSGLSQGRAPFGRLPETAPDSIRAKLAVFDTADARAAQEALEALALLGEPAARAALDELLDDNPEPTHGRKWRARLVAQAGEGANLAAALSGLDDPDPSVRLELATFLARPGFGELIEERVAALERLAIEDSNTAVRRRAIAGLGALDEDAALRALNRILDYASPSERQIAARGLARAWRARPFVMQRVRAGFAPLSKGTRRTSDDVLALLLPAYGRMLAEQPAGGETALDRVPLVLGLRHPNPQVQAAAGAGFDALVRRLRLLADEERTLRILDAMDAEGFDRRVLLYERSLTSLRGRPDPLRALDAAQELRELCGSSGDVEERGWRVSAYYLEALARFAAGDCSAALAPLAEAGRLLDGLLAERVDEARPELDAIVLDWLHQRSRVHLFEAVLRVALALRSGASEMEAADTLALLEELDRMHLFELEAQLVATENQLTVMSDLDPTLDDELSPLNLMIETPGLSSWTVDERLSVARHIARGIRTVVPEEMPGFEAFELDLDEEAADVLAKRNLTRRGLLGQAKKAYVGALQSELNKFYNALELDGETMQREIQRQGEFQRLVRRLQFARQQPLNELRFPSTLALRISGLLREEAARPREARELVQAMRADLEADGTLQSSYQGMEIAARIDMSIGASYMDEDAPRRSEIELEKAVERLEEFEQAARERGFSQAVIARIRAQRSTALVSLAVNANVKLNEPDRALAFFERAYELRQDDFMKVLLACYRARSNEDDAARRLLRDVRPAPDLFYNLACTYALLGEADKALQFLRREFEENHVSETSRAKQQDWAREDPDLSSLRGDPRFVAITGS